MKKLVAFHTRNKYLFMNYNQLLLKRMGNYVANHDHLPTNGVFEIYEEKLRVLLSKEVSMKKRINVLFVLEGWAIRFEQDYLKNQTIFEPYPRDLIMVTDSGKKI